jgi:hypothetical protein
MTTGRAEARLVGQVGVEVQVDGAGQMAGIVSRSSCPG